jgi:hypothetical protein
MRQGPKASFETISEANEAHQSYGRYTKLSYESFMAIDIRGSNHDADQQWYDSTMTEGDLWRMIDTIKLVEQQAGQSKAVITPEIERKLLRQDMVHYRSGGQATPRVLKALEQETAKPIACVIDKNDRRMYLSSVYTNARTDKNLLMLIFVMPLSSTSHIVLVPITGRVAGTLKVWHVLSITSVSKVSGSPISTS